MSADILTYAEWVGNQIISNAALETFCLTNFVKKIKVFVGQDSSELPSEDDCPMIVIVPGGRGLMMNENLKSRSLQILMATAEKTEKKMEKTSTSLWIWPGLAIQDQFADIITGILKDLPAHSSGEYSSQVIEGPPDVINFPIFKSWVGLAVQIDV